MPLKLMITIGLIAGVALVGALLRRHRYRRPVTPKPHERPFDDAEVRKRVDWNRRRGQECRELGIRLLPERERPPDR